MAVYSKSQPTTPVAEMKFLNSPVNPTWPETMHPIMQQAQAVGSYSLAPADEGVYQAVFSQRALYDVTGSAAMATYQTCPSSGLDPSGFAMEPTMQNGLANCQVDLLRSEMFTPIQVVGQDTGMTNAFYAPPAPMQPSAPMGLLTPFQSTTPGMSGSGLQASQIIVPSQLSPHDDSFIESYSSPDYRNHDMGMSRSFDSISSQHSGWDSVDPPSPDAAYFAHSDEEGYIDIKPDESIMLSRGSSMSESSRRRPTRKGRKSILTNPAWYESEVHNMTVRLEGKKWLRLNDGRYVAQDACDSKPNKCDFEDPNTGKICGSKFDRKEHLKRHQGMHSNIKDFCCPMPQCVRKNFWVGRVDNAGDHFKTHLKPPKKGKRNQYCTLEYLEELLREQYSEARATKLITNLRKWKAREDEKAQKAEEDQKLRNEEKARQEQMAFSEQVVCRNPSGRRAGPRARL